MLNKYLCYLSESLLCLMTSFHRHVAINVMFTLIPLIYVAIQPNLAPKTSKGNVNYFLLDPMYILQDNLCKVTFE